MAGFFSCLNYIYNLSNSSSYSTGSACLDCLDRLDLMSYLEPIDCYSSYRFSLILLISYSTLMGRITGASLLEEMLFFLTLGISEVELMVGSSCMWGATAA